MIDGQEYINAKLTVPRTFLPRENKTSNAYIHVSKTDANTRAAFSVANQLEVRPDDIYSSVTSKQASKRADNNNAERTADCKIRHHEQQCIHPSNLHDDGNSPHTISFSHDNEVRPFWRPIYQAVYSWLYVCSEFPL